MTEEADAKSTAGEDADAEDVIQALGDTELRALDAQYESIAPFKEWADLVVDDAIWSRQLKSLEHRAAQLTPKDLERALTIATRAAAVDSGAIEDLYETNRGLTLNIAVEEANWQTQMRSHNERMPDFFEAQLAAYDLASEIAAARQPITEAWLRQLHEVLLQPQATYRASTSQGWAEVQLPKGEYKTQPNHVQQADGTLHAYAPVDSTSAEMHRLVEEIKTKKFERAHPVLQAGYVHYCLVAIHPFADGNGRVARALASVFLRRKNRIPLLIWADQRTEYFDALEAADREDRQTFVDFVFERAIETLALVETRLGPRPEDYLPALTKLHISHGGLTFQELDERANWLVDKLGSMLGEICGELAFPRGVTTKVSFGGPSSGVDDENYRRPVRDTRAARLTIQSGWPAKAALHVEYQVLIARKEDARYAFKLLFKGEGFNDLEREVPLRDVHPSMTDAATMLIRSWLEQSIGEALAVLTPHAEESHRNLGI